MVTGSAEKLSDPNGSWVTGRVQGSRRRDLVRFMPDGEGGAPLGIKEVGRVRLATGTYIFKLLSVTKFDRVL